MTTAQNSPIPEKTESCMEVRLNSPRGKFEITNKADDQVDLTLTWDQALLLLFFLLLCSFERHKGIIGRGHDLRLILLQRTFLVLALVKKRYENWPLLTKGLTKLPVILKKRLSVGEVDGHHPASHDRSAVSTTSLFKKNSGCRQMFSQSQEPLCKQWKI